ncbi:hypothetical protein IT084_02120 [Desulfallas sp. Bu1-1]|uniref:hypothetical protein n=1 Tax=Desulfallas sp. Bu1-1 TaxID=2787620 RepID=UPI00189F7CF1|nr:hypothetical protein [Desulfallas sp. Bu1-1]MBF7081775.1 hypothetical protein [Desulfallas sp. Bu1-1]
MQKSWDFAAKPWLVGQMAAKVEAPGPVEERADLLAFLSGLPLKRQAVSIGRCAGRDELVECLNRRGEYGVILTLLRGDLAGWVPGAGDFSDLKWLLETLLDIKKRAAGKKARVVFQTPSGPEIRESASMLEMLLEDAVYAAAGAWVRCLCGPGGDHRVWELPPVLSDPEMAEAVFIELAGNPRALALLLEDVPRELASTGLEPEELVEMLQRGARAAEFCHNTIIKGIEKLKTFL